MTTKSTSAASKGEAKRRELASNNWEQAEFINRELTETEAAGCKNWAYSEEEMADALMKLIMRGYKVTFRWDEYHNCAACWFLPPKDDPDNAGLILTGRGSTAFKAAKQGIYKHHVLFEEIWPRDRDKRGSGEIDD